MTYDVNYNLLDLLDSILVKKNNTLSNATIENVLIHCRFTPTPLDLSLADIKTQIPDKNDALETVYLSHDRDIFFWLTSDDNEFFQTLTDNLISTYGEDITKNIPKEECIVRYNFQDNYEQMKSAVIKKQAIKSKKTEKFKKYLNDTSLVSTLKKTVQLISMQRSFRVKPHILIIEDQAFSQKMLTAILSDYTCHIAGNIGDAFVMYLEKCPDIVLLDIDLPDLNGHLFAGFLRRIDDHAHIIMISCNKTEKDLRAARDNKVNGFISKPFDKTVILNAIEQFSKNRTKRKNANN